MAVSSRAVTVTTAPTRIDADADDNIVGQALMMHNGSTATVFIGGPDVTTANGVPVEAGTWAPTLTRLHGSDVLYGVVASLTAEVRVLDVGI